MYYHVLIETKEKTGKNQTNKKYFELDKTDLSEIKEDIIFPYLANETFQFNGYFLNRDNISRVVIKESDFTSKECSKFANDNLSPNVILYISPQDVIEGDEYVRDITKKVFKTSKNEVHKEKTLINLAPNKEFDKTKVFIVHGHDDLAKTEVARFIENLKLEAIILHEQANSGKTIIEKIEEFSNVGFGLVLYTPCDVGTATENKDSCAMLSYRARQNVVFEHGYLIGKIGRSNVCALVKGEIETPNDISGVVYIPMDNQKAWQLAVAKELRNSGYDIDMNLII